MHDLALNDTALPALIATAGERGAWRYVEFFTVTIRNRNTRTAYHHAATAFLTWCEEQSIRTLTSVQPIHVAAYIEGLRLAAPTVKQHLAALRMLFDWLVTGQIIPANPAHAVRGPRHSVTKGATRVISSAEATALLSGMDISSIVGLRNRAIIAVMTYTFARVSAVVALTVEDYYPQKNHWWLKFHEKNGKVNEMPCHPKLAAYLDEYLDAAGIGAAGVAGERKTPLFRAVQQKKITTRPLSRTDAWCMVRRRAKDAGIATAIGCHTFRATGLTDYLTNGGRIEVVQRMAGHSNAKTTGLYDRRSDDVSLTEVAKIGI
jgi:integrase/recombinase XerD